MPRSEYISSTVNDGRNCSVNLLFFSLSDFLEVLLTEFRLKLKCHVQCTVSDRVYEFNYALLRDNLPCMIECHRLVEFDSLLIVEDEVRWPIKYYRALVIFLSSNVLINTDRLSEIN